MSEPIHVEIATRARKLIELRGTADETTGMDAYVYVGAFYITIDFYDQLEITVAGYRVVYEQAVFSTWGKLLYPEYAQNLLDVLRKEMILDDLASV